MPMALLFLAALLALSGAGDAAAPGFCDEIAGVHLLRPILTSIADHLHPAGVHCESWRLGVETDNIRDWRTVPSSCGAYVGNYMLGGQYRSDSAVVADEAIAYAGNLTLTAAGKGAIWVFDIDETSLSNLPYYAKHGFGVQPFNATAFDAWVATAAAPPLPETLRLYNKVLALGIKPVFLTGRVDPTSTAATVKNLRAAGYHSWEKLILKPKGTTGTAMAFKSGVRKRLEEEGYVIVGNVGDQWSDILGSPEGRRTFKLPDPLYYIA